MQNTSFDNEADYNDDLDFAAALEAESCVKLTVPLDMAGLRLDSALAKLMPDYSRSRLATWIKEDLVIVMVKPARPKREIDWRRVYYGNGTFKRRESCVFA